MAAAMPATKRRVQELSIEPVGGRSTAVPAGRFDRGCVRGAAFELPELMERAMVARGHAFPAVPYPSAGIRSCGAKTRADASLRHTQQAGDGTNVDRCEFDTLVRIDGHAAQLRDGDMAGQRVQSGELPQHADDGFVGVELARYLESRGLDPDPGDIGNQGAFLLGKASDAAARAPGLNTGLLIDPREGIAAATFYDQIKAFFTGCADVLRGHGDARGAERFARASTHWMRHSHASHAIAGGMPIEIAQQNLGHASLATTTVYVTTEAKRRMKAIQRFWAK